MTDISSRLVWLAREPRSGSTGLGHVIAKLLNRKFLFITSHNDIVEDPTVLLNMHDFKILDYIRPVTNPILLRCIRRNKTEQFLSQLTVKETWSTGHQLLNIDELVTQEDLEKFENFTRRSITVVEEDVRRYCLLERYNDTIWNAVSKDYENYTFYYEDVPDIVDIPVLGLYNIELDRDEFTKKFPDYKRDVYTNYSEVEHWINKYYP